MSKVIKCKKCDDYWPIGHYIVQRYGHHAWCKKCRSEYGRKYYQKNKEELRKRRKTARPRSREHWLLSTYGITEIQYEEILIAQGGVCAICKGRFSKKLGVDHCHRTMGIRGILCERCNLVLGLLIDDPELFHACASYLERFAAAGSLVRVNRVKFPVGRQKLRIEPPPRPDKRVTRSPRIDKFCGCGKRISSVSIRCLSCAAIVRNATTPPRHPSKVVWPEVEILMSAQQGRGLSRLAKSLGVSETAVRKRIKRLALLN